MTFAGSDLCNRIPRLHSSYGCSWMLNAGSVDLSQCPSLGARARLRHRSPPSTTTIAASLGVHCDAASAFKAEIEVTYSRLQCRATLASDTAGRAGSIRMPKLDDFFRLSASRAELARITISAPSGCRALIGWRMGRPFVAMYHAHPMPNSGARTDDPTRFQSLKRRMLPASKSSCRCGWHAC